MSGVAVEQEARAERLLEAAVALALEEGLGALSARKLAERAKTSPSAMNYHFGRRDHLLRQLQDRIVGLSQVWREARSQERFAAAPPWMTLADAFSALIQDRLGQGRMILVLLSELEVEAMEQPALAQAAGQEVRADAAFWLDQALALGADAEAAQIWSALASGLITLLIAEPDPAVRAIWITAATTRLGQRLAGAPLSHQPPYGSALAVERLAAEAPKGETPQRILEAALKVLGEAGADRLTQRDVAACAGVSLAAITYFYRTKADLIAAALGELHRQISNEVLASNTTGARLSPSAVMGPDGTFGWRLKAMWAMQAVAARDPRLAPVAAGVRATRGATSAHLLARSGADQIDGLDAFVWSTVMGSVLSALRFAAPASRQAHMADAAGRFSLRLFKVAL